MKLLRTLLTKLLSQTVFAGANSRYIFLFHDISAPDEPHHSALYSTFPERFREQIDFLEKHFLIVALDDIISDKFKAKGPIAALTFDDGFFSVRSVAFPILSAKGLPFTVFLNRQAVLNNSLYYGDEHPEINKRHETKVYLDEEDIKFLERSGVTFGSHSSSHKVLSNCNTAELKDELDGNRAYLESLLRKNVGHLALPYGKREHYNRDVLDYCQSVGHEFVYSTNPVFFNTSALKRSLKLLPRISILNEERRDLLFLINRPFFKRIDI